MVHVKITISGDVGEALARDLLRVKQPYTIRTVKGETVLELSTDRPDVVEFLRRTVEKTRRGPPDGTDKVR